MSTFTPKFGFEKPDLADEADVDVWRENTHKYAHVIKNLELETNAGFAQRDVACMNRNTASSSANSDTSDTVWYQWDSTGSSWYAAGDHSMGRIYSYTTYMAYQFEHPGIYRIGYNLRVQTASTAHTEGSLRAALYFYYNDVTPPVYIPGTHTQIPVDTYLGYTDIYCETLVYVSEYNEKDQMVYNYGDDVLYSSGSAPNYQWEIRWCHSNDVSATATTVASGYCWFSCEFVRAI